jgi:hypothetical protein
MKPAPKTITLGERTWTVRPLTLAQLEELEPVVQAGPAMSQVAYGLAVVAAGLRRDHPEDAAAIRDLEATAGELATASAAVLTLGGYIQEQALGEARAAESAAASISASSTAASPPDAATPPA